MNRRYKDEQGRAIPYRRTAFGRRRTAGCIRQIMAYGILTSARSQVSLILASDMPQAIKSLKVAECVVGAVKAMEQTLRGGK